MAIFYTYPSNNAVTGKEEVLVSVPNKDNELRIVDLQSIANLKSNNSGVNRIFFEDSIGLSPSFTEAGANPNVGTGVVEITGKVNIAGGGTGKDITDLATANVGDILTINQNKDGYDFSPQPTGETYTFSTAQNSLNADLTLTDSQSQAQTVRLVPGASGNITLTVDDQATPQTITIESAGGGSNLTPGNGIDITGNTISAKIAGGLGFNSNSQIVVDLTPKDLADTTGITNGAQLEYFSSGGVEELKWVNQSDAQPVTFPANDIAISHFDTQTNQVQGTSGVVLNNQSQVMIASSGKIRVLTFYLDFFIEANNELTTGNEYFILTKKSDPTDPFILMTNPNGGFHGSVTCCEASIVTPSQTLTDQWQTLVEGCFIPTSENLTEPRTVPPLPQQLKDLLIMQGTQEIGTGKQTTYIPTTEWIKPGNTGANFRYILAGTITVF